MYTRRKRLVEGNDEFSQEELDLARETMVRTKASISGKKMESSKSFHNMITAMVNQLDTAHTPTTNDQSVYHERLRRVLGSALRHATKTLKADRAVHMDRQGDALPPMMRQPLKSRKSIKAAIKTVSDGSTVKGK
jgi:hypothetical protein